MGPEESQGSCLSYLFKVMISNAHMLPGLFEGSCELEPNVLHAYNKELQHWLSAEAKECILTVRGCSAYAF